MSQQGTIISAAPYFGDSGWIVMYSYALDAGGVGQAEVLVSNSNKTLEAVA
jgi:hypothetical protein